MRLWFPAVLALWSLTQSGCQPESTGECLSASDCGSPGDVLCLERECHRFDDQSGFGQATVAVSFPRETMQIAMSGRIHLFSAVLPTGQTLACEGILADPARLESASPNPLQAEPKYIVFDWTSGGNFFPDILVPFVRPAERAVCVVEAFELLLGGGRLTALGCTDAAVEIVRESNTAVLVPMQVIGSRAR